MEIMRNSVRNEGVIVRRSDKLNLTGGTRNQILFIFDNFPLFLIQKSGRHLFEQSNLRFYLLLRVVICALAKRRAPGMYDALFGLGRHRPGSWNGLLAHRVLRRLTGIN